MGHEDDSFGAMFDGILDRWEGTNDPLVVGDFAGGVKGNVKINLIVTTRLASPSVVH